MKMTRRNFLSTSAVAAFACGASLTAHAAGSTDENSLNFITDIFKDSPQPGEIEEATAITAEKNAEGADLTLNPSWKNAGIVSIDGSESEKTFSELDIEYDPEAYKDTKIKVKQFSNFDSGDLLKSSKINGKFTQLKAKSFSFNSEINSIEDTIVSESVIEEPIQKDFSVATVKERVRIGKMSPRQRFRLLVLEYKQAVKQAGGSEKMDPETLRVMKSLFTTDLLDIMKTITPEIMKGKNPGTLLGASSLGKNVRISVQKLFLPYKMALQEVTKMNAISKNRYQKIQAAYVDFTNAMLEEIFAPKNGTKKEEPVEEENPEENS